MLPSARPLRVLTWQVHGNYLFYLTQLRCEWWLATRPGYPPGYGGRGPGLPWGDHVYEIDDRNLDELDVDLVLYQSRRHWEQDRFNTLPAALRALPAIYLEHDPPQQHPSDTEHWAQDAALLVHVTPFNRLMWDNGEARTKVIEHAVRLPDGVAYNGRHHQGLAVVNHLERRGRRLGADVYRALCRRAPLHLVGMGSESMPGGLGEVENWQLPQLLSEYRYLFNPIRWTSLGLSVVEAMTLGVPVIGLATTELSSVIQNGHNGWIATDPDALVEPMLRLTSDPALAARWGAAAKETAQQRFSMERFVRQWQDALDEAMASGPAANSVPALSPVANVASARV